MWGHCPLLRRPRGRNRTVPAGPAQPTIASPAGPIATLALSDWELESVARAPQEEVAALIQVVGRKGSLSFAAECSTQTTRALPAS